MGMFLGETPLVCETCGVFQPSGTTKTTAFKADMVYMMTWTYGGALW